MFTGSRVFFLHGLNPLVEGSAEDTLMLDLKTISLMLEAVRWPSQSNNRRFGNDMSEE